MQNKMKDPVAEFYAEYDWFCRKPKLKGKKMAKRQKCEVFSRSMGYIRPVSNFNIGKKAEFEDRKTFKENIIFTTIKKLFK